MNLRRKAVGALRRLNQFLLVEEVRTAVTLMRYVYYARLLRRLETVAETSSDISEQALSHNSAAVFRSVIRSGRTHALIRPLSVVQPVAPRIGECAVLCVGPRAEGELLNLLAHGFRWRNITGLDLVSYSPKIDIGDMHAMAYGDDSFDVVIASRVLGYSESPARAAREFVRVVRPGGVIAVNTGDLQAGTQAADRSPGAKRRMTSLHDLLALFGDAVDQVYHSNDPAAAHGEHRGPLIALFSVRKQQK